MYLAYQVWNEVWAKIGTHQVTLIAVAILLHPVASALVDDVQQWRYTRNRKEGLRAGTSDRRQ